MHTTHIVCGSPGSGKSRCAKKLVVIVGPFTKELRDPHWPGILSQVLGGPVEVHYVICPPETRRQRLAQRGEARDLAKLRNWEQFIQCYG